MGLTTGETDVYSPGGGAFGGFGNGLGGFGLVGLIGLNSFLGNNGNGFGNTNGSIPGITNLEQNVSDLRQQVADVGKETHILGNELQMSFNASNVNNSNNFRALDNQICGLNQNLANLNYANTIQGMQNTQSIKDQASAFQVIAAENACSIKSLIQSEADQTRALITENLIDDLRSQLAGERRSRDNREIEINVTQSNNQLQAQLQQQQQQQTQFFASAINQLGDQINRSTNSLINVGSGTVAGSGQNATQNNTKVNG